MNLLRQTVLMTVVLALTASYAEAQDASYESAYQIDPISFAISGETSRNVRYVNISGTLGKKGRLTLDANVCSLDEFGERAICTLVYYRPFDVKLPKIAEDGSWTLYGIVPQDAVFHQYTLRLAVNKGDPATANLLLNSGLAPDVTLRVITLRRATKASVPAATPLAGTKHTVRIKDFKFAPKVLTIKAGDSVVWVNEDTSRHNAQRDQDPKFKTEPSNRTPDPMVPNDDLLKKNEKSKPIVFNEKGRLEYFCRPHKSLMKGFILVE